jgi:SAM-dependent methyltransferase
MEEPAYALGVFRKHFERTAFAAAHRRPGFTVLELGPGDSLGTALVAKAFGAGRTWLVDVAPIARRDLGPYRALAAHLRAEGLPAPGVDECRSIEELLHACNARYLTGGLESLREIASDSADLVFSNAVYEHIRRAEVVPVTREIARILRPGGATSHSIDLQDHLGGGLAHLRFPDEQWESEFMVKSGFYTNRLRWTDFVRAFDEAGLAPELVRKERFARRPRGPVAKMFAGYPAEVLEVSDIDIVATRPAMPMREAVRSAAAG